MPRHFDDLMLGTLELFCRAAELQSFSQAAQVLNISPAAVSKTIARLEQKLGSPLFVRTTRHVRLTEAGEQYLSYCRTALDAMYDAENALQDMKTIPAENPCLPAQRLRLSEGVSADAEIPPPLSANRGRFSSPLPHSAPGKHGLRYRHDQLAELPARLDCHPG